MARVLAIQRESYSSGQRQQKGQIHAREVFTMSFRFHHVHVICKDLEKMIGFFTESIGAELVRRKKFGTADGASLSLKGTTLNLRVARADEKIEGDASRTVYGYNHIGLEVEDIEAAYTDLRSQGYSFFMPHLMTHGWISLAGTIMEVRARQKSSQNTNPR